MLAGHGHEGRDNARQAQIPHTETFTRFARHSGKPMIPKSGQIHVLERTGPNAETRCALEATGLFLIPGMKCRWRYQQTGKAYPAKSCLCLQVLLFFQRRFTLLWTEARRRGRQPFEKHDHLAQEEIQRARKQQESVEDQSAFK